MIVIKTDIAEYQKLLRNVLVISEELIKATEELESFQIEIETIE